MSSYDPRSGVSPKKVCGNGKINHTTNPPIGEVRGSAVPINFKRSLQILCVSLAVILRQIVAKIFDSLSAGPVLRTLMHYSITFCRRPETASDDPISTMAVD